MRGKLTYANVMSTLAVVIAVAGGSTAIALTAGKNSVRSGSIADGQVTARDLGKVRQFAASAPIDDAVAGDGISAGAAATAKCPRRWQLLSGGVAAPDVSSSEPMRVGNPQGWQGGGSGDTGPGGGRIRVVALCLAPKP